MYAHNPELVGELRRFDAADFHGLWDLDGATVRKWRNRGYFTSGEKSGRGYQYVAKDIAKLMILREMNDVGVQMITAATAADLGCEALIGHCLAKAPLIQVSSSVSKIDHYVNIVRTDDRPLPYLFGTSMDTIETPHSYLVTGGDDFDDWQLIDSLEQLEENADFNLATIVLDLDKMATRMVAVMARFNDSIERLPPLPLASFHTSRSIEGDEEIAVYQFSTDEDVEPIKVN